MSQCVVDTLEEKNALLILRIVKYVGHQKTVDLTNTALQLASMGTMQVNGRTRTAGKLGQWKYCA